MNNTHRLWITVTLLLSFNVANAEVPQVYKDIVEKTISNNPEVQAKLHEYTASLQEQKVAKSNYYPVADIIYRARSQQSVIPNINNTEAPDSQAQFVITQMLFDGLATPSQVNRLGHAARVRYYELQAAMLRVALDISRAYIDVQRSRELVGFAERNYVALKQMFDKIEERVNAGVARKVDLEQASGRVALAESSLLTELANLQNVSANFQRLSGEMPPANIPLIDMNGYEVPNAKQALETAYQKNPNFLAAAEDILATEQEVRGNRAGYLPQLNLRGTTNPYTSRNGINSALAADTLELTASFNLFRGFRDQAIVAQAAENLNRSFDIRDQVCRDVRQEVSIAQNDILVLKDQVKYRKQHQLAIENARLAYRKQFDIGQRSLLDLLDTENEYFQASRSYVNAVNDLNVAYARTYASEGTLLNKVGVTRGDLPEINQSEDNENYAICTAEAPEMFAVDKAALLAAASSAANDMMLETKAAIMPSDKIRPPVEFEENSAKLKPSSYAVLDSAVKVLKEWGDAKVEVAGHTDKRSGSETDYNLSLSKQRAQSVADYLVTQGIDSARLIVNGYGFNMPIAKNDPITGSFENRRVELIRQK